ncbi:FAD:protein FMN transferase [Halomonas salipaludis]|uniref:FAD:protein FMN transferase n=1 Tax=Halomonas salipaludis TaxID=2032625 RepID=A0A2A2EXJ2_9GAMM|nr:FAD:protein FMN transferase [Halomonas salipaludis]PAU77270.1 thiamine biosynthesis protein [Halomonas salipaludis]
MCKRYFPLLLLLAVVLALVACAENERQLDSPVALEGEIFGTFYQVTISDSLTQHQVDDIEAGILEELEAVDAIMSIYRDDSELTLFNEAPLGEWQLLSNELMEIMSISQSVSASSNGAFDVTIGGLVNLWSFGAEARPREVPDESILSERLSVVGYDSIELDLGERRARRLRDVYVDLGGVAKGFGTDRVAAYLDQQGIGHYLVSLGGDLIVRGYRDSERQPWRIGIEAPLDDRRQAQHILPLRDVSVATSGDYRNYFEEDGTRYSHTIDPRTGRPIQHQLASVTVAHAVNAWADAWATAMMVLGDEEGMELAIAQDLAVLMLVREADGWGSYASPAFAEVIGQNVMERLGIDIAQ